MKPIYEPRGKAKEYGDYAINIYTGCPHRCYYCFAPSVLKRDREIFHSEVRPREGIVEAVKRQLEKEQITGKTIHLCFTCDPYPTGYDTTATREVIKAIKAAGNHVQILTKGDGSRDFDLLDENDWYGITITGGPFPGDNEPGAMTAQDRVIRLGEAKSRGIKTMERLTQRNEDGAARFPMPDGYLPPYPVVTQEAVDRLAAYEDIGLTPEEIEGLKKDAVKMRSLIAAYELNGCIGTRQLQLKSLSDEEKQRVYMGRWNIPKHPCEGCGTGWGSANSEEVHTCEETCEKLAAWNEQQKKEVNHD